MILSPVMCDHKQTTNVDGRMLKKTIFFACPDSVRRLRCEDQPDCDRRHLGRRELLLLPLHLLQQRYVLEGEGYIDRLFLTTK